MLTIGTIRVPIIRSRAPNRISPFEEIPGKEVPQLLVGEEEEEVPVEEVRPK